MSSFSLIANDYINPSIAFLIGKNGLFKMGIIINILEFFSANKRAKSKIFTLRSFHALIWLTLASGLTLGLSFGGPVQAATLTVTKTADTADGNCDADCSLREAILAANASPGADTIHLPNGTYTLSIVGGDEDASATGDLDITDDLTIIGVSAANTIIDGAEIDRVFEVDPVGAGVVVDISHVTVKNGSAPDNYDFVIVRTSGGGIHNRGILTLTEVIISGNKAIYFGYGGGLHNVGTANLVAVRVSGNMGYRGGGIGNLGTLTVVDCVISDNTASGGIGGGGGLRNGGTAEIRNTTLSGNEVVGYNGGGIENTSILNVFNSTVSGNKARVHGGGIANFNLAWLANVTIADNIATAGQGGGVYTSVETVFENTLLSYNTASGIKNNCHLQQGSGHFTDYGYNLEDSNTCGFASTGDVIDTDPLLGTLKDNGGPTPTHALLPGSPAIDGGNPEGCSDMEPGTYLGTDQRGFLRPIDGNRDSIPVCDIGAYEYVPSKAMPWLLLLLDN